MAHLTYLEETCKYIFQIFSRIEMSNDQYARKNLKYLFAGLLNYRLGLSMSILLESLIYIYKSSLISLGLFKLVLRMRSAFKGSIPTGFSAEIGIHILIWDFESKY